MPRPRNALHLLTTAWLCGCTTSKPVVVPDGSQGWSIDCSRSQIDCISEAQHRCPNGYDVVAPPASRATMTIRCRAVTPAAKVAERSNPSSLPKRPVLSSKRDAELKAPPNQPDYPCPDHEWGSDDAPKTPKGSDAPASRKRDDDKNSVNGRLPPEVIQRIVRGRYANFRSCYEQGLGRDPNLIGRVTVRFVIGRDGTVASIEPVCTSMPDREVVRCITEEYKPLTFPQPEGGIVTVVYPIMFSPAD